MRFIAAVIVCVFPLLAASPAELEHARKLYRYTDYSGSLQVLAAIQPKDGPVYALTGQNLYMQGEYKKATESLEKALAADPDNSDYALWLGRAYGRRAETSSPFTAPPNASKARQNFEKAVQLNPRNMEALSDLFEYYLEAPGFMGGGLDKASATAEQMAAIDPVEGHWAQARLAEKKKEFDSAEEHLQRAAEMAPHRSASWSTGPISGQAGPLSGKRSEFPQGREDRAKQPQGDLRARRYLHPARPQPGTGARNY